MFPAGRAPALAVSLTPLEVLLTPLVVLVSTLLRGRLLRPVPRLMSGLGGVGLTLASLLFVLLLDSPTVDRAHVL